MEQPKEDPQEWVTEDSLDTAYLIEDLFLTLIHGVMTRTGDGPRSRVNRRVIAVLRRLYKKHGRVFEPGASTPPLPAETIEALMWFDSKPPVLDNITGDWLN